MSDSSRPPPSQQKPYDGPAREATYGLSRLSGPVSLVDVAREIEHADTMLASVTHAQLSLIADQINALRAEAERVLAKAKLNAELHRAEARFVRHPGKTYHLYERSDASGNAVRYWSLLSPADWGGAPPHRFVGSYRLEVDQTFTPLEAPADNKP